MTKLIPIALIAVFLSACSSHIYPLRGQYPKAMIEVREYPSEKKDELWARIMTFFVSNNIPIKTLDKSAGFIKSERLDFKPYTWGEDVKQFTTDQRDKMVVTVRIHDINADGDVRFPFYVTGAIEIFTIDSAGITKVRISIDDLASNDPYRYRARTESGNGYTGNSYYEVYSFGKLEGALAEYLIGIGAMPKCHFAVM